MTIIIASSSPKTRKSDIFGLKFKFFFCLHESLQRGKFKGAYFKYDNGLLTIAAENT